MPGGTEPENWGSLALTSLSPLRRGRRGLCPCQRGPAQSSMPLVSQALAARPWATCPRSADEPRIKKNRPVDLLTSNQASGPLEHWVSRPHARSCPLLGAPCLVVSDAPEALLHRIMSKTNCGTIPFFDQVQNWILWFSNRPIRLIDFTVSS